jgi:hypothetical protein
MGTTRICDVCDALAGQLDALLVELEPAEETIRGGDLRELVELAQTSLKKAAAIDQGDNTLTDGVVGLIQMTAAAINDQPGPDGLELEAIGQIVHTAKASRRAVS